MSHTYHDIGKYLNDSNPIQYVWAVHPWITTTLLFGCVVHWFMLMTTIESSAHFGSVLWYKRPMLGRSFLHYQRQSQSPVFAHSIILPNIQFYQPQCHPNQPLPWFPLNPKNHLREIGIRFLLRCLHTMVLAERHPPSLRNLQNRGTLHPCHRAPRLAMLQPTHHQCEKHSHPSWRVTSSPLGNLLHLMVSVEAWFRSPKSTSLDVNWQLSQYSMAFFILFKINHGTLYLFCNDSVPFCLTASFVPSLLFYLSTYNYTPYLQYSTSRWYNISPR